MKERILIWMFTRILQKIKAIRCYKCSNRYVKVFKIGVFEVSITYRDTTKEDSYSREELVTMLKVIRNEEQRQQWKVPEPTMPIIKRS